MAYVQSQHWRYSDVFNVDFEHISKPVLVFLLLTLSMHFFLIGWQFISCLVHLTFFSLMKHERIYVLRSQFSTNISAVNFSVTFKKLSQLFLGYFFKNRFRCWHILTWLLKFFLDVYIHNLLRSDKSGSFLWNSDRTYIFVVACLNALYSGSAQGTARIYKYALGVQSVKFIRNMSEKLRSIFNFFITTPLVLVSIWHIYQCHKFFIDWTIIIFKIKS